MDKEYIINSNIEEFTHDFNRMVKKKGLEVPEINDDKIKESLIEFFNKKTLTEAQTFMYHAVGQYVEGEYAYRDIDWNIPREEVEKTEAYKLSRRYDDIESIWSECRRANFMDKAWVDVNGKTHTNEEAANIAADKWCELIFNWHLQDNGALNETHGGGFPACALGTILADKCREKVTEEMKVKAHELFYEYYLRQLHFSNTSDMEDIKWLKNTFPDETGKFDWKYGFCDLSCDYDPSWALYLILLHAGIPEKSVSGLCPWKTRITIRDDDNTVMYYTYQHCDEL